MARERSPRGSEPFPEPDMLPLMNIILMLILALITMAAMMPLGLLSTEAQKLSRGLPAAATQENKKPLTLIVFVTEAGFNISVYGDVKMGPADPANPKRKLPLVPNLALADGSTQFDFVALKAKLVEFKKLDAEEQSMTLTADPEVKFDTVVHTMDAARFDDDKKVLFPKVTFAAGIVG
jgi:biopolymer transport protein ExbD